MVATLAFALIFVAGRVQREMLGKVADLPDWSPVVAFAVVMALLLGLAPRRFFAMLGLRHPFAYPPYWFGIAIGAATALGLIAHVDLFAQDFQLSGDARDYLGTISIACGLAPGAAFVFAILRWLFARNPALREMVWRDAEPPSLEQFRAWVLYDATIADPANDLFGHAAIARRMGQRLIANECAAQALVGKLGSGKSTIRDLVEIWLRDRCPSTSVEIVRIELWPYESPRAAVEGILTTVVEALSREVNTSQLDGLPAAYGEAIAKISGVADWIPKILRKRTTPAALLEALDSVATAIGRRYVLWVEDLERFAAGDPNAPAGDSELERLAPIRALLHGLDQRTSITVVTATTDLFRRFDLEKISRYVERIPEVEIQQARRLVSAVRNHMLREASVIDPAEASTRNRLGWDDPDRPAVDALLLAWLGESIRDFASAVAALAKTPRILKQGLRRAYEIWNALKGEIDLDEVIALSILREAHPGVFALVERHSHGLRVPKSRRTKEPSATDQFKAGLATLSLDATTSQAVQLLVQELFGAEGRRRPQGVSQHNHADYWRRFLAVPELAEHERDQPILRSLQDANDDLVIDLLTNPARAPAVEDFAHLLPQSRVDGLLSTLVPRLLHDDISKWDDSRPPGLVDLWRMVKSRSHTDAELQSLVDRIDKALELAAPANILMMYEVAHWFATSVPELQDLLPAASRRHVNDRVRTLLVDTYLNKPKDLAARFRGTPPPLLLWLTWSIERIRNRSMRGLPFDRWPEFAKTLLDTLTVDPEVMSIQIAGLVTDERRRFQSPNVFVFDEEQCKTLFGDVDEFVEKMRTALANKPADARVQAVLDKRTVAVDEESDADGAHVEVAGVDTDTDEPVDACEDDDSVDSRTDEVDNGDDGSSPDTKATHRTRRRTVIRRAQAR